MGCDIHTRAQKRNESGAYEMIEGNFAEGNTPFDWRQYGMFGFLAGVRNYSEITPISIPRGLPDDMRPSAKVLSSYDAVQNFVYEAEYYFGDHSYSWLSVAELVAVDYEKIIEDRRYTEQTAPNSYNGAATCEPGKGEQQTLREFLGEQYFHDLAELQRIGAERIVFGFDS